MVGSPAAGGLEEVVHLEVMAVVVGGRALGIEGRECVEHIEVWSEPMH